MKNLHWPKRLVVHWIARHAGNLLDQGHRRIVTLSEDCVATIKVRGRHFSNEKLRAVRIRACVRVCEASRLVEQEVRGNFVFEFVSGVAGAVALGITSLNHKSRNHTMKDGAVVKRHAMFGDSADWILPIFRARGEADKILDSDGRLVWEQGAGHIPGSSLDNRGWLARVMNRCLGPRRRPAGLRHHTEGSKRNCSHKQEEITHNYSSVRENKTDGEFKLYDSPASMRLGLS